MNEPAPLGATVCAPGKIRFRLWAPRAPPALALEIEGRAPIALRPGPDGYAQAIVDGAPGLRYRYRLAADCVVPDPASRLQDGDVHGHSVVVGPDRYPWRHTGWRGRPWQDSVIYEAHAGLCGGYAGLRRRLPEVARLGVTLLELMPIADFPGPRNWGYDGVLPYAPDTAYGTPDELKALIDAAHGLEMGVMLDVVYNHFGPDGNYLHRYAADFFDARADTPWGAAIDYRQQAVQRYFIDNALYWLRKYRFDGLRLDAVHAMGRTDWLAGLAREARAACPDRRVHLVVENDANQASLLEQGFDAQWNDDAHHVLHHLLTGERQGYYADYAQAPAALLARALGEGYVYQGQAAPTRGGRARGEPSAHLPPWAFVLFLHNHDQVGNRADGLRLTSLLAPGSPALRAAIALQLLAPHIPLLFMGEEYGSTAPFFYFTSHGPELAAAVRAGRAREFAASMHDCDPPPDPNDPDTYRRSCPWPPPGAERQAWFEYYRELLRLRARLLGERLTGARADGAAALGPAAVRAAWRLGDGARLTLYANLLPGSVIVPAPPAGQLAYATLAGAGQDLVAGVLRGGCALALWEPAP